MTLSTEPHPATLVRAKVGVPLLREPPFPPGYVDPLEGNRRLTDLVDPAPQVKASSDGVGTHTG